MPFSVCRAVDWHHEPDNAIMRLVAYCPDLRPVPKLLLISLILLGTDELHGGAELDALVGLHRNSRQAAMRDLRDLGLVRMISATRIELQPLTRAAKFLRFNLESSLAVSAPLLTSGRDPKAELADAWNRLKPLGYSSLRVVPDSLAKAVNSHMSDLGLEPYDYERFFQGIAVGVESSEFWLEQNSNKTLASITGLNRPTDRKRANVLSLYEKGAASGSKPERAAPRLKHTVYPGHLRPVISEYIAAQFAYAQAFDLGAVRQGHKLRVVNACQAVLDAGFDPQRLRRRFPQVPNCAWPDPTLNPEVDPPAPAYDDDNARGRAR